MKDSQRRIPAIGLLVAIGLATCGDPAIDAAPPSTRMIVPSADGLASLFMEECMKQRNIKWVAAQARRQFEACDGFLVNQSNCRLNLPNSVSWIVPTTIGTEATIEIFWWGDRKPSLPKLPLSCAMSVRQELAGDIRKAAHQISAVGFLDRATGDWAQGGLDEAWVWKPLRNSDDRRELRLSHYMTVQEYGTWLDSKDWGAARHSMEYMHSIEAAYPWKLQIFRTDWSNETEGQDWTVPR